LAAFNVLNSLGAETSQRQNAGGGFDDLMNSIREIPHEQRRVSLRRRICCRCNGHYLKDHPLMTFYIVNLLSIVALVTIFQVSLNSHAKEYELFKIYFPE
jgi:hypothetical protein